jgi:hypothetical protein
MMKVNMKNHKKLKPLLSFQNSHMIILTRLKKCTQIRKEKLKRRKNLKKRPLFREIKSLSSLI